MTDLDLMNQMGAKIGDFVIGKCPEDGEETVLHLIGFDHFGRLIARSVRRNGRKWDGKAANWTLKLRDWKVYQPRVTREHEADNSSAEESNEEEVCVDSAGSAEEGRAHS